MTPVPLLKKPNLVPHSKPVTIYTDGACSGNPGPGGWGALLKFGTSEKELKGGEAETTNNRMELQAAREALSALKRPCKVILYTDSVYLRNGMAEWLKKWKAQNWKTATKKPVKNKILWQEIDALNQKHTIEWKWIKGHAGHAGNERADYLARQGMEPFLAPASNA